MESHHPTHPNPVLSQGENLEHPPETAATQAGTLQQAGASPSMPAPPPYEAVVQESSGGNSSSPLYLPANAFPLMDIDPASHDESAHLPGSEPAQPVADPVSRPPSASRNQRRARVEDDVEDDPERRQSNRQRMHSPPTDGHDVPNDHHFHPDMHAHAADHRQQQQQQAAPHAHGPVPGRLPLPFNRVSFHIDILPLAMPPGSPHTHAPPPPLAAAGTGVPPGFPPLSFEVRFPFPTDGADGATPNAHPAPGGSELPDFNALFQRLLRQQLAQMGNMEEPDDPQRAKRLLAGLEEVPEGLVKRMERVAGDEGVVCAICFDSLASAQSVEDAGEKEPAGDAAPMEVELEGLLPPQPTRSSESDAPQDERKTDEELVHKVVVLPCAHVFHASCLRPWFTRPHRTTCPTCRFDIDPESLTYTPPAPSQSRRASEHPVQGPPPAAGAATGPADAAAHPQAGAQVPIPPAADATAPQPLQAGLGAPPVAGAGPAPGAPQDPHAHMHPPPDVPYIIFDVSMLFPIPQPGQHGPQAPVPPQPHIFGPAPPPAAANVPGAQPGAPFGIEQLLSHQPAHVGGPRQPPGPTGPPVANAQALPTQPGNHLHVHGASAPLPFWRRIPGARPLGVAPQGVNHGAPRGFGDLFANMLGGFGRPQNNNVAAGGEQQPQAQAQPQPAPLQATAESGPEAAAPNTQPGHENHHNHAALPSFEEFMNLVGLPSLMRPQGQPTQGDQPQPAAANAPPPEQPQPHPQPTNQAPNAQFEEGLRHLATSIIDQILPPGLFMHMPPPTGVNAAAGAGLPHIHHLHHHHHPNVPMPPPGPIPFTVPTSPRAQPRPEKRRWTPPVGTGPTLRERVERKERELGLRCADISCGLGPSDDDPTPVVDARQVRQIALRPAAGQGEGRVCEHTFHAACLVSAERVAGWSGADAKREVAEGEEEVQVSCPVCRAVGCISREDWDEGACALA